MSKSRSGLISFSVPIVFTLVAVLVLALTVQMFLIITPLRNDLNETQKINFSMTARTLSSLIEVEFLGNEQYVRSIAETIEEEFADASGRSDGPHLSDFLFRTVENLKAGNSAFLTSFITDEEGIVLYSSSESLVGADLSAREYYKVINDGADSFTTNKALVSTSTGKTTIVHAAAVKSEGVLTHILGTSYDLEIFAEEHVLNIEMGKTGEVFLLDGDGMILVHPDENKLYTSSIDLDKNFGSIIEEQTPSWYGSFFYDETEKRGVLVQEENTGWYVGIIMDNQETDTMVYHIRRIYLISNALLILLVALLVTLFIKLKLGRNISHLEELLNRASEGDLTDRGLVKGRDEIAGMTSNINTHLDSLSSFFRRLAENLANLENEGAELSTNMEETAAALTQIRTNVDNTRRQIGNQEESVASTASAVEETDRNIHSLERNIELQNADIEQGTAAVEQMVAQINHVTISTGDAENIMNDLSGSTQEGRQNLNDVSRMIQDISNQSNELESANTLISGIAAQTNLLAMNAAIEAAHAGKAGQGFAVVADEIRKLAEQSAIQSTQVRQSVKDINESIRAAVTGSELSNRSFEEIGAHMDAMRQITEEIRASMEEQSAGGGQILASFVDLKNAGLEVQLGAGEMTRGNQLILSAVQNLMGISGEVIMAMKEIDDGMNEINNAVGEVAELTHHNKSNIEEVREHASMYKVTNW